MSDDTETLAEHWHWDEDDAGAFRCGYVERREPCPVPERLYVLTPDDLAARIVQARAGEGALAEAWERGWADAQRSAYTAPLPHENPYRALTDTAGDPREDATGAMRSAVMHGPGTYSPEGWHALCVRTLERLALTDTAGDPT